MAHLFERLIASVRQVEGAFITPKIQRTTLPPSDVPGLVACEPLSSLELIARIPAKVQLTRRMVWELAPELKAAARPLLSGPPRSDGAEAALFVARRLKLLRRKAVESGRVDAAGSEARSTLSLPSECDNWLDFALGLQLGEGFHNMPLCLLATDAATAGRLLKPSPEVHSAVKLRSALRDARAAVIENLSLMFPLSQIRGESTHGAKQKVSPNGVAAGSVDMEPDLDEFIRGHLLLQTRAFMWCEAPDPHLMHRFVPVVDMLNHKVDPNVSWCFTEQGDFIVKTSRPIPVGEELFISYGDDKSNPRLLRNYGFTVPSSLEPRRTYRVFPSLATDVYQRFFANGFAGMQVFDLETRCVTDGLRNALTAAVREGSDPQAFLSALCEHFARPYERDELLRPALSALERARAETPGRAVADWEQWLHVCVHHGKDVPLRAKSEGEGGNGGVSSADVDATVFQEGVSDRAAAGLYLNALRVKMSEYICLVAHSKALELVAEEATVGDAACVAVASQEGPLDSGKVHAGAHVEKSDFIAVKDVAAPLSEVLALVELLADVLAAAKHSAAVATP